MATIYVDNEPYEVEGGENLLDICLSLNFDLPYFCWHPALGSVGACRQCAIKQYRDENDQKGRLVMACMTAATDGQRISLADSEAAGFRASVIEWLMVNHPHDCPVCDEGGECHLQDMTLMTGHVYRRYRFPKRTYRNQYLGPFINHEMNRCIQCYRCVRFYRDYAGGKDLDVFGAHDQVYFGRAEDGVLESEFSGNLVEVCPTGVFTDKTLKEHYTRKWDLQTAPSLCIHCSAGCNTIAGERYGELRRILNRYHHQVNGYFICDRGRFGYGFVNHRQRIKWPLYRRDERAATEVASRELIAERLAAQLSGRVIGIGSPRASLEANFALREFVGAENFFNGMSERDSRLVSLALDIMRRGPARAPSIAEQEKADAVLVLGEDVTSTQPRLALTLRQAVRHRAFEIARGLKIPAWDDAAVREAAQQERSPLFIATTSATGLDDIAAATYRAAPDDLARLGFAVARQLGADSPPVTDLSDDLQSLAEGIAQALSQAERPLVVSGASSGSEAVMQAAANIAWAIAARGRPAALSLILPEANSLGVGLLGGESVEAACERAQQEGVDTLIVVENDLYRRADASRIDALFGAASNIIVVDHLITATALKAGIILPAATFAEGDGTMVNSEGRAQRFYQVFAPEGGVTESWRWVREMMGGVGRAEAGEWRDLGALTVAMARRMKVFEPLLKMVPPAPGPAKIGRQSHRFSGRTAILANITVHEPKPPEDPDSPLAFSMESYGGPPPPSLIPRFWAPGWNSAQSVNKFQSEVGGPLRGGDPGVRLIEPDGGAAAAGEGESEATGGIESRAAGGVESRVEQSYFGEVPRAFEPRAGEWLIAPRHHIFGTEELSAYAEAIAERAPQPYVAMSPDDAAEIGASEGDEIDVEIGGAVHRRPLRLDESLRRGVAGFPIGLGGTAWAPLPGWGRLSRALSGEGQG